jgi:Fe-S-cluster containining protein
MRDEEMPAGAVELQRAITRLNAARERGDADLAELKGRVNELLRLLTAKGVLNENHSMLIDKMGSRVMEQSLGQPRIRLRQYVDKYTAAVASVDCPSLFPLCHGRCCGFSFELTTQDLDEGKIRFEITEPYLIRQELDGYCTHLDRKTLGCGVYEHRPLPCRTYDCRQDPRVWIDFDKRIPAPMPVNQLALRVNPPGT